MPIPPIPGWVEINTPICQSTGGAILTLPAMTEAYDESTGDEAFAWFNDQGSYNPYVPDSLSLLFDPLPPSFFAPYLLSWLFQLLDTGGLTTTVLKPSGQLVTALEYEALPEALLLSLLLGEDVLGGGDNLVVSSVLNRQCVTDALIPICSPSVNVPGGDPITQLEFFQALLNKMDDLLACCNPCNVSADPFIIFGQGFYTNSGYANLSHVDLGLTTDTENSWTYGGDVGFKYLGRFRFRGEHDTASEMYFWNSPNQRFYADRDGYTTWELYVNPLIEGVASVYERPFWRHPGEG